VTDVAYALLAAVSFGAFPLLDRRGLALGHEYALAAFVQNVAGAALVAAFR
jgi:hypothetical protein